MKYKVVKLDTGGFVMTRENSEVQILREIPTVKDLKKNDKKKIVAVSEDIYKVFESDDEVKRMRLADCNDLFHIKQSRPVELDVEYKNAKFGSIENFKGMLVVTRHKIYDYLSGRMTHAEFINAYYQLEEQIGLHGLAKVHGFREFDKNNKPKPDNENKDDEYFNTWLEDEALSRELNNYEDGIIVDVHTWHDEQDFIVMFKSADIDGHS
jgi:hypothetical protein